MTLFLRRRAQESPTRKGPWPPQHVRGLRSCLRRKPMTKGKASAELEKDTAHCHRGLPSSSPSIRLPNQSSKRQPPKRTQRGSMSVPWAATCMHKYLSSFPRNRPPLSSSPRRRGLKLQPVQVMFLGFGTCPKHHTVRENQSRRTKSSHSALRWLAPVFLPTTS